MPDDRISAVLTPRQLGRFCRMFGLRPDQLEANFSGWHKHVLLSDDKVFLFPRSPEFAKVVARELAFYKQFSHSETIALPKLIKKVKDRKISYYEFGAVTRLEGIPFSQFINEIDLQQLEQLLLNLTEIIASWHSLPVGKLPKLLSTAPRTVEEEITVNNWHRKVLSPETTETAIDCIYRFIQKINPEPSLPGNLAQEIATKAKWTEAIKELAGLSEVLVHGDVHEDHILVESDNWKITGIVDWETARIDHPIWDFNFGEWDWPIFKWMDSFPALRRKMWRKYLAARNIKLENFEGLHFFYTLWDLVWMIYDRRFDEKTIITKTDLPTAIRIYLDKLNTVTELL